MTGAPSQFFLSHTQEHCPLSPEDGNGPVASLACCTTPLLSQGASFFPRWESDSFRSLRTWNLQQALAGSSPDGLPARPGPPLPGPSSALAPSQPASRQSGAQNWGARNAGLSSSHCGSGQQTQLTHCLAFTCTERPQHLRLRRPGDAAVRNTETPARGSASVGRAPPVLWPPRGPVLPGTGHTPGQGLGVGAQVRVDASVCLHILPVTGTGLPASTQGLHL